MVSGRARRTLFLVLTGVCSASPRQRMRRLERELPRRPARCPARPHRHGLQRRLQSGRHAHRHRQQDKTARVWDAHSGKSSPSCAATTDIVVTPPSARTARASSPRQRRQTARVWDAAQRQAARRVLRGHDELRLERRLQPGRHAHRHRSRRQDGAGLGRATAARAWPLLRGHERLVYSAAFSPDGTRIVTASARHDGAGLGRRAAASSSAVLRGHERTVYQRRLQPGRHAHRHRSATTRPRGSGTPRSGKSLGDPARPHEIASSSAAFSPDGTRIVTASEDKTARVWDARSGKSLAVLRGHSDTSGARPSARRHAHRYRQRRQDGTHLGGPQRQEPGRPARPHRLGLERRLQP